MFYMLALLLCLAVMFIVAAGTWMLCALSLSIGKRFLHYLRPRPRADCLFMLRALPWLLACLVTLGFAFPAFLFFEPRSSNEILGLRLLLLAGLGALAIVAISVRSLRMIRATHHAQKQWRACSRPLQLEGIGVPIYCTAGDSPLLAVTGIFRPKIFVAQSVVETLSSGELFAAIAHELAHVSAWDNLKQLVLKTTGLLLWLKPFAAADAIWLNASEMAADERALAGGASLLDLSSALVKVARLSRSLPVPTMLAASHLVPMTAQSLVGMRVNHLRILLENEELIFSAGCGRRTHWPALGFMVLLLGYSLCLNAVLPWMHEVLELLVR